MYCNGSNASFCCPVPCPPNPFDTRGTLIGIKRCLPIRTECQDSDDPVVDLLYTAQAGTPTETLASGIVSIINTSPTTNDCTMTLSITDDTGTNTYDINAQSSQVIQVTNVTSITIVCTSDTPPDPPEFCTATVELDFQYTAGV
ncbi:MAG: S-Ena type endospore appendage [Bacillota bacterium]|nr:S-Ena type endospore appendage [Bacillota bacterium]